MIREGAGGRFTERLWRELAETQRRLRQARLTPEHVAVMSAALRGQFCLMELMVIRQRVRHESRPDVVIMRRRADGVGAWDVAWQGHV